MLDRDLIVEPLFYDFPNTPPASPKKISLSPVHSAAEDASSVMTLLLTYAGEVIVPVSVTCSYCLSATEGSACDA